MQYLLSQPLERLAAALSHWPDCWARSAARHHGLVQRRLARALASPPAASTDHLADALVRWQASGAAASFDAARELYAESVRSGHAPRSLLASARVERCLHGLERLALGPWARTV